MYNGSVQAKIHTATIVRQVTDLAGYTEFPFVTLGAKSDAQRDFAGDVRFHAITQIWTEDIDQEYKTAAMARAIIAACNRHPQAQFWLDNKDKTFVNLLSDDIDEELGE